MTSSGMSAFAAVHVLGVRADLVLCEAVEGLADQLEVLAQVSGALRRGQARQDGGVALLAEERRRRIGPPGLHAPEPLPPRHPAHQLGDDVGHEGGGDAGLHLAVLAVRQCGPGGGHRSRGVRHVVGDHLVGVDPAAVTDRGTRLVDEVLGQVDRVGGGGEHGGGGLRHGARP